VERGFHGRRGRPAKGRGEGVAKCVGGEKGAAAKKGKKGKRPPLGFLCGRNKTTPLMTLT
jgi:hypothetical protein